MIDAISTALNGLMTSSKKAGDSAAKIANVTTPGANVDLAQEIVTMKIAEISYKANASVLKTAKDMQEELGRVFDETV